MAEKIFDEQKNLGWLSTLNLSGKFPAVSKRIFDTYADALEFANDVSATGTAIPGLILTVVSDEGNNGAYFLKSVASAKGAGDAVLEKIGSSSDVDLNSLQTIVTELKVDVNTLKKVVYSVEESVETVEDLNKIESPTLGEMRNVESTGMNYVWNGKEWDPMSEAEKVEDVQSGIEDIFV